MAPASAQATGGRMQIGALCERVGLSLRTVRYYEEQGLVVPEARTDGGFRLYAERQVERLGLIKQMKPIGFSLDEMRELLAARDVVEDVGASATERTAAAASLAAFADLADARCARLRAQLEVSQTLASSLRGTVA